MEYKATDTTFYGTMSLVTIGRHHLPEVSSWRLLLKTSPVEESFLLSPSRSFLPHFPEVPMESTFPPQRFHISHRNSACHSDCHFQLLPKDPAPPEVHGEYISSYLLLLKASVICLEFHSFQFYNSNIFHIMPISKIHKVFFLSQDPLSSIHLPF